jgi:uncharacterized protein YjbI with pentapeptide repeats
MPKNTFDSKGNRPEQLTRKDVLNLLEQAGSPEKLNLSRRFMRGIDLSSLDLSGANLAYANLYQVRLSSVQTFVGYGSAH